MDCFAISIVCGVIMHRPQWPVMLRIAFFFGFFQALMPFVGWLATAYFAHYIAAVDHWVAFGILAFLGIRMIRGSFRPEEEHTFRPERLATQLTLAVATSIDALAVGISFSCMGYATVASLALPLVIIGITSFLFSLVGHRLGLRYGAGISRRLRPELVGGIILVLIGIKVLLTHLLA